MTNDETVQDHVHHDGCDHGTPAVEAKKPSEIPTRIYGQHVFFVVKGSSVDSAYTAARAMGVKVLEAKRLRAPVPALKEEKEIEVEETAEDGTKSMVKKTVQVLAAIQPAVYRQLGDSKADLERRVKSHGDMKTVAETEFSYVVKAMGDPSETLE